MVGHNQEQPHGAVRTLLLLLGSAAALMLGGCGSRPDETGDTLADSRPCYIEGVSSRAACYDIAVPEDWSKPGGKRIRLNVAVLPATGINRDGSALFLFAGGPGQAATQYGDLVTKELDRVRATRPIILMDQRGTGGSNGLRCAFGGTSIADVQASSSAEAIQACRRRWGDVALQHYATPDVVRDVEAVRAKLGFDRLDLWGASWGTRAALLYMRQHPARVRSAVLDGVTGPNSPLFLKEAEYAGAALEALFADCAADKACAAAFPNLRERALARLRQDAPAPVRHVGPDGQPATIDLAPDLLRQIVRGALYAPESAARLPFALDRLLAGDGTPILAIADGATGLNRETMFHGATFSSLCAEEMPRVSPDAARAAGARSFAGDSFYRAWAEGCAGWPTKRLSDGYGAPVTVDVPVLLLSGGIDPVTPPASAQAVETHLQRAWHIVAPASGHNVTAMSCAGRVIAEFVRKADGTGLDASCLAARKRPPFMVSPLGPKA